MVLLIVAATVSGLVSLAIKELYAACKSEAAKHFMVDESLVDLCSSYKKIGDILLGGLDCWVIPAGSIESQCWHDLVMCWYETEDLIDHIISVVYYKDRDKKQIASDKKIWDDGGKISILKKKLDTLGEQFQNLLPKEAIHRKSSSVPPGYRGSLQDSAPFVVGTNRDMDKQTIICELIKHEVGVSIVGMDGLGKTTLARIIAADESFLQHFKVIVNLSISGDYFVMEDVVEKLHREETGKISGDYIAKEDVKKKLLPGKTRKTLILLDDLSNVTDGEWERFRCRYLDSNTRILTTTRNPKVAEVTGSFAYYLDKLKDEDCAKIIKEKSNVSRFNSVVWDDDISEIAKKCMGMPLIASKFGLTLLRKTSEDAFQNTIKNLRDTCLWDLVEFKEIFPSFKLNDPELPPHLIRCFAYCSLFSPKYGFKRSELIQLWKVEGLQPSGSQCFDDLLQRSIFCPLELCIDKEQSYTMQDLNYCFAQLLASQVFLRIDDGKTNSSPSPSLHTRHMSLACQNVDFDKLIEKMEGREALRTILMIHPGNPIQRVIDPTFFDKLQGVRVLDLSHTNISEVLFNEPASSKKSSNSNSSKHTGQSINISAFKHLRYLDLSGNKFTELPKTIYRFRALQVLKLKDCKHLKELPDTLWRLSSLTHLDVNMSTMNVVPPQLGKLTKLEVLTSYKVINKNGTKASELGTMEHLRELHVTGLNAISNLKEAEKSSLLKKKQLKRLTLEWRLADDQVADVEQEVLEGLEPSADLKHLTVRFYKGTAFPAWFSNKSKKLVSISLEECKYCVVLPSLKQLPLLRTLSLRYFDSLEIVSNQFCATEEGERGFPRLEKLEFKCLKKLVSWVQLDARSMPRLQSLVIESCPHLQDLPSLEHHVSLVNLEIKNAPKLKALPKLPSSMNGDNVNLSLQNCSVLKERCQKDKADWEKIKNIREKRNIFDNFKTSTSPP